MKVLGIDRQLKEEDARWERLMKDVNAWVAKKEKELFAEEEPKEDSTLLVDSTPQEDSTPQVDSTPQEDSTPEKPSRESGANYNLRPSESIKKPKRYES